MVKRSAGLAAYVVPLLGLMCIGGGVAAFGILLAVAGGDHGWLPTVAWLVVAFSLCIGGYTLLTRTGKNTGGWRMSSMDPEQSRVYRAKFRGFNRLRRPSRASKPQTPPS